MQSLRKSTVSRRPAVSASRGYNALRAVFPRHQGKILPGSAMHLRGEDIWPPRVDSKARGRALQALAQLLPMSLQWVDGSQGQQRLTLR